MIIILRDKGRILFAASPYRNWGSGVDAASMLCADNLAIWVTPDGRKLVAYEGVPLGADILRYDSELFEGESDFSEIMKNTVPRISDKYLAYGLIGQSDGSGGMDLIVAEGDRAVEIASDWTCNVMGESIVFGPQTERRTALASLERTRGLSAKERALGAFRDVFRINRIGRTVMMVDTASMTFSRYEVGERPGPPSGE